MPSFSLQRLKTKEVKKSFLYSLLCIIMVNALLSNIFAPGNKASAISQKDPCKITSGSDDGKDGDFSFSNLSSDSFYRIFLTSFLDNTVNLVDQDPINGNAKKTWQIPSNIVDGEYFLQLAGYESHAEAREASPKNYSTNLIDFCTFDIDGDGMLNLQRGTTPLPPPDGIPDTECYMNSPLSYSGVSVVVDQSITVSGTAYNCEGKTIDIGAIYPEDSSQIAGNAETSEARVTSNTFSSNVTFHKTGRWELRAFRIDNILFDTPLVITVNEKPEKLEKTSCAFCSREEGFFYYDQPNNRCCKYYGCTIPQDLQEDLDRLQKILSEGESTSVNQSTALLSKVQEEQKHYIVPATDKECDENEYCIPGRGCNPTYPDPGKPPCAEGAFEEATGKCYTVQTAVAFVDTDPAGLVRSLLGILLSISGMIALYFIIRSGYQLMTSRGNPEVIQAARERLTSAIVGLLFILFSLVILQVIGVDLLRIPGFGE